ncbi:hypothetical protein AB6G21_11290 [Providencia hangzhouensis]|uniref:hypothetical protein n=1 Tax=Providencia hangzhouensis TaxID=3031799 RepID=UPI0034DD581B
MGIDEDDQVVGYNLRLRKVGKTKFLLRMMKIASGSGDAKSPFIGGLSSIRRLTICRQYSRGVQIYDLMMGMMFLSVMRKTVTLWRSIENP